MTDIIGNRNVNNDDIVSRTRENKEEIEQLLNDYPSYFINLIQSV